MRKITKSEKVLATATHYLLELIKRELSENGGNESAVARKVGITPSAINRLLSGDRGQGIKLDTAIRIVTQLGGEMGHLARLLGEDEAEAVFDLSKEHAELIRNVLTVAKNGGQDLEKLKQDAEFLAHRKSPPH